MGSLSPGPEPGSAAPRQPHCGAWRAGVRVTGPGGRQGAESWQTHRGGFPCAARLLPDHGRVPDGRPGGTGRRGLPPGRLLRARAVRRTTAPATSGTSWRGAREAVRRHRCRPTSTLPSAGRTRRWATTWQWRCGHRPPLRTCPFASFAGQQDSFLDIVGADAVVQAVRRCWASLWTDRAVAYRTANGISHREVGLAVVVQQMVDAGTAGVLFTANPVTGTRTETVIDASPGRGRQWFPAP